MPDFIHKNSEDPDALPVNERSSSFIDGVAFLDFVRLKSLATSKDGSAAKNDATPGSGSDAANDTSDGHDHAMAHPPMNSQANAQLNAGIDVEDWDSLFGAVEERLRTTVDELDSTTAPLVAPEKVSRIKSVVLDCVSALDKLHQALIQERSRHVAVALMRQLNGATSDTAEASRLTNGLDPSQNNQPR